jgi:hypothetical protein
MQNYNDKFGAGRYRAYGKGNYLQSVPQNQPVSFNSFAGGLDMRESREDVSQGSSPNCCDVEITQRDRLRPVAGVTAEEELTRTAQQLVLHASLDYTSELVLFDPPFIGVKTGDTTEWFDVGLPTGERKFTYVNFGGTLLLSNGRVGLYAKKAGENDVELVEDAPAAHSLASFAGRVFAGGSVIGGNREPLGISWSAPGSYEEWRLFDDEGVRTGAGFELLIDDMAYNNYFVAQRTMGLDFLAIFLRNSIWIGRKSGQPTRPADFQARVVGLGVVNEASCVVTRFGVVHLHDSGVYLFDGNTSSLISEQINPELLPLDSELSSYSISYNPGSKQVLLFTPACTWAYDLERQRWIKRSLIARGASLFTGQIGALTWAELTGTWAEQDEMWEDYKARESEPQKYLFLSADGTALGEEEVGTLSNFGEAFLPYWESGLLVQDTSLMTLKAVTLRYCGGGQIELLSPNTEGELGTFRAGPLRTNNSNEPKAQKFSGARTGNGFSLRIQFTTGTPEISRFEATILPGGPRIEKTLVPFAMLTDEEVDIVGYFTDFSNYPLGQQPTGWNRYWRLSDSAVAPSTFLVTDIGFGNYALRAQSIFPGGGTVESSLAWDALGTVLDGEVVIKVRFNSLSAQKYVLEARTVGDSLVNHYRAGVSPGGSEFRLRRAGTTLTQLAGAFTSNVWYGIRLRFIGTAISAKIWLWQDSEPASWTLTATDSVVVPAGKIAIALTATSSSTNFLDVDLLGVAFNGDTAPTAPAIEGWYVPPGGFNIRLTEVPTGYKVRVDGVVYTETSGIVILNLLVKPAEIEFLTASDVLFVTYDTDSLEDRHSYSVSFDYQ